MDFKVHFRNDDANHERGRLFCNVTMLCSSVFLLLHNVRGDNNRRYCGVRNLFEHILVNAHKHFTVHLIASACSSCDKQNTRAS